LSLYKFLSMLLQCQAHLFHPPNTAPLLLSCAARDGREAVLKVPEVIVHVVFISSMYSLLFCKKNPRASLTSMLD
jgi:hypothetical protein